MRRYRPDEPLISLHVPKTAGTSLRLALEKWFPGDRLLLHYQDTRTLALPARHTLRGGVCVHGHFEAARGYGVDAYYPEATQYIVFLRDPFERAISLYSFIRKHQGAPSRAGWAGKLFGRETRGGDFMPFEEWIPFLQAEQAAGRCTSYPCFLPGAPDVEAARLALTEKSVFVGTTETYPRSLDALAAMFGKTRVAPSHVNRTARPAQDFARWRDRYADAFPEDYILYDTAVDLNRQSLAAYANG